MEGFVLILKFLAGLILVFAISGLIGHLVRLDKFEQDDFAAMHIKRC
jgi:hypothetical protein